MKSTIVHATRSEYPEGFMIFGLFAIVSGLVVLSSFVSLFLAF